MSEFGPVAKGIWRGFGKNESEWAGKVGAGCKKFGKRRSMQDCILTHSRGVGMGVRGVGGGGFLPMGRFVLARAASFRGKLWDRRKV